LHGSGDVRAYASEEAKVRLHGSGDVTVKGRPKVRDSKVAGSGDIDFDD
ncbi:GIN domain-containing protein, partial [Klebsiella pneumoniae]